MLRILKHNTDISRKAWAAG